MLKNFFDIKLNPLSNKILSFWEKEFNSSLSKHINFLTKNIENQENIILNFQKYFKEWIYLNLKMKKMKMKKIKMNKIITKKTMIKTRR